MAFAAIYALIVPLALGTLALWEPLRTLARGNDAPAWAQAILSAVSILVGSYIAAKVAQRPILAARHQRLAALLDLVEFAADVLRAAKTECDTFDAEVFHVIALDLRRFDRAVGALAMVNLSEISPGILASRILLLQEDLLEARSTMEDLLKNAATGIGVHGFGVRFALAIEAAETLSSQLVVLAGQAAGDEARWWMP